MPGTSNKGVFQVSQGFACCRGQCGQGLVWSGFPRHYMLCWQSGLPQIPHLLPMTAFESPFKEPLQHTPGISQGLLDCCSCLCCRAQRLNWCACLVRTRKAAFLQSSDIPTVAQAKDPTVSCPSFRVSQLLAPTQVSSRLCSHTWHRAVSAACAAGLGGMA